MKILDLFTPFRIILLIVAMLSTSLTAQTINNSRRNLPPIDYTTINPDAFEPGIFRIKFSYESEKLINTNLDLKSSTGTIITGVNEIDALHQQFNVKTGKSMLSNLYNSPLKSSSVNIEKHEKHGLNRWYEFETDGKTDLRELIFQYKKLENVEVAELVFKIVPILPVDISISQNPLPSHFFPTAIPNQRSNDVRFNEQWHYHNTGQNDGIEGADIDLLEAWNYEKGKPEVIVAVIDGGVDFNHPDLAANIWPGIGPDGENTYPDNHGTHVAGTIAAVNNNDIGVAGIAGGSGNGDGVRIMSLDLFTGRHGLNTLEMNVWAADNGAAISQNSWGYILKGIYNQSDLDGIDYFNEFGGGDVLEGGITFFAAGNDSDNGHWYPACYEGAIAVASTNNKDQLAWYSNYGEWVEISAPGGETFQYISNGVLSTTAGNRYNFYQGTSMACPHVSGVAALIVSHAQGMLTNEQLKTLLLSSTDDIDVHNPSYTGQMGAGRLNAHKALEMVQDYMGNVRNPYSFSAEAISETAISLNWNLNQDGHNVIIAVSENQVFGTPEYGVDYVLDEEITGGGRVIFTGNNDTFTASDLTRNTNYHFRVWSYDDNPEYSYGRKSSAKTFVPQMSLSTNHLDFGLAYIDYPKTKILKIRNNGQSDLTISEIQFSNSSFSSQTIPSIIEPGSTIAWEIIFESSDTGSHSGTLHFSSNDPETPEKTIYLSVVVSDEIPSLEITPTSIEESLNTGEATTRTMEISNTGSGELAFNIDIVKEQNNQHSVPEVISREHTSNVPNNKLKEVFSYSEINTNIPMNGGSSEIGYFWDTPDFKWYNTIDGTKITLGDDDFITGIPVGFSFKYFDQYYDQINIMSNGWVSFTHISTWFPSCVPNLGGAIVPFGRDLLPDYKGEIRYITVDNSPQRKFIIEYNNIRLFYNTMRVTFQVIFFENSNNIVFQYLKVPVTPESIGIENAAGTKGIGNCGSGDAFINKEIVTDELAICFSPASHIRTIPREGIAAAGETITIEIIFDAFSLIEGTYNSDIRISSNDPLKEMTIVPTELHVSGIPNLEVSADNLAFGETFIGKTTSLPLIINNSKGTASLNIAYIQSSGTHFQTGTFLYVIEPGKADTIEISFTPENKLTYTGSLTIISNDPDYPEKVIALSGYGTIHPTISATPTSFEVEIFSGDFIETTLTITNDKAESRPLEVSIFIDLLQDVITAPSLPHLIYGGPSSNKSLIDLSHSQNIEKPTLKKKIPISTVGPNILYLTTHSNSDLTFFHGLESLTNVGNIDLLDVIAYTPNVDYLMQYDIVIVASNRGFSNNLLLGNNLAEYIDQNGRLCALQGTLCAGGLWALDGKIILPEYMPLEKTSYTHGTTVTCNSFINHPITKNVNTLSTGLYSFSRTQGEGISMGEYNTGYSIGAYNPEKPVVAINVFPSDTQNGYGGDLLQLMSNTIDWLYSHTPWLDIDINQTIIPEGTSKDARVVFDASGLTGGEYNANITIESNDPENPTLVIPAKLNVIDAPNIALEADTVDFGNTYVGKTPTHHIIIKNSGSTTLTINNISVDNSAFTIVTPSEINLEPNFTDTLKVKFTPVNQSSYSGEITIISNDPTGAVKKIILSGSGKFPALIEVTPTSITETLLQGEDTSRNLTIQNSGRGEPLNYTTSINYTNSLENKENGPDQGGYFWRFDDIQIYDISEATHLNLPDDGYARNVQLNFSFEFYGTEYSTINVMSNGWLSFSDYSSGVLYCVPDYTESIAPYSYDLNPASGGSVKYQTIGESPHRIFIVEYDVPLYGTSSFASFQILLKEGTNEIVFQYLKVPTAPQAVGISSKNPSTGIGNCASDSLYIDPYAISPNMAIHFSKVPTGWLSPGSYNGIINSEESSQFSMEISSLNLTSGVYYANIEILSNDPFQQKKNIPVVLNIYQTPNFSATFNVFNQFGQPVSNAILTFESITELPGNTSVSGLENGTYDYTISKAGYNEALGQAIITDNDFSQDIELFANIYELNLMVDPQGSGVITGQNVYFTDQLVYISAYPDNGFQFYNWRNIENNELMSSNANYSFQMPPNNLTLWAIFGVFSSLSEPVNSQILVYPNPASDQINITHPQNILRIELTDLQGRLIDFQKPNGNEKSSFNIQKLYPTLYFITVVSKDGSSVYKFIKNVK